MQAASARSRPTIGILLAMAGFLLASCSVPGQSRLSNDDVVVVKDDEYLGPDSPPPTVAHPQDATPPVAGLQARSEPGMQSGGSPGSVEDLLKALSVAPIGRRESPKSTTGVGNPDATNRADIDDVRRSLTLLPPPTIPAASRAEAERIAANHGENGQRRKIGHKRQTQDVSVAASAFSMGAKAVHAPASLGVTTTARSRLFDRKP